MPRVSRAETERNRVAIEEASARLFKAEGFRGVSVADLMAAAGLTHGGFYGHFESKDALAAIACEKAFDDAAARWEDRSQQGKGPGEALRALVKSYLSSDNLCSMEDGCPMAAFATDVAREPEDKPVHEVYVSGVTRLLNILMDAQPADGGKQKRQDALAQLSTMVGALILARATKDAPLSRQIMTAARQHLLAQG